MSGNESAFPEITSDFGEYRETLTAVYSTGGMTKREYFAAKAMQAIFMNAENVEIVLMRRGIEESKDQYGIFAAVSCEMADALIAELAKENPHGNP